MSPKEDPKALADARNVLQYGDPIHYGPALRTLIAWAEAQQTAPPAAADGEARALARCAEGIAKLGERSEAALLQAPPAAAVPRKPDGYAYRYRDGFGEVVRFNNGQEVNGCKPIEAIPYWLQAPPADEALADTQRAIIAQAARENYAKGRSDGYAEGYERGLKEQPAAAVPEGARLAMRDALSACLSVSVSRDRRVVRDGAVLYLQTEEWCKWLEDEIAPRLAAALAVPVPADIEKKNPNGERCLSYGINGNGQAECHWPECGCYPAAQQPAAAVPSDTHGDEFGRGWNACRNAMLAATQLWRAKENTNG